MSFLITGANGLIGCDLAKILSKKKKVIAIYRKKKNKSLTHKNIIWVKHDLKNKLKLKYRPKYIINCVIDETYKEINPKKYFDRNILITKNIINYAKKNDVDLIFNLSSVDVYGKTKKDIITEKTLPKAQSDYGYLKYMIEKLIINSNCNYLNLRVPGTLCFGSKYITNRPWINLIINKIIKNENLIIYNPNQKFNNVTSSYEIARFINHIIKKKVFNNTFNFATKSPLTINQITKYVQKEMNSKNRIKKTKNKNNKGFYISIKKIEKKTDFKLTSTKKLINKFICFLKK